MRAIGRGLRPYARRQRWPLLVGATLAVAEVLVSLAAPWPIALLVGHVLTPGSPLAIPNSVAVLLAALATITIAVAAGLVDYWSTRLLSSAGLRMAAEIRVDVFNHVQRMSLRYHSGQRVSYPTTRITSDVDRMQDGQVGAALEQGRWGRLVPAGDRAALVAAVTEELGRTRRRAGTRRGGPAARAVPPRLDRSRGADPVGGLDPRP